MRPRSFAKLRPVVLPALACLLACLLFFRTALLYTRPAQDLSVSYREYPAGSVEGYSPELVEEVWEVFLQVGEERTVLTPDQNMQYTGLAYNGQTFYYSAAIEQEIPDAILVIGADVYGVSVFLDGELLYTNVPGSGDRIGYLELPMLSPGANSPLSVSLPEGHKGKTLTIAQSTSPYGGEKPGYDNFVPLPDIMLYSRDTLTTQETAQGFSSGLSIAALALLGASFLVFMLLRTFLSRRADWSTFFLALFVLLLIRDQALNAPMAHWYSAGLPFRETMHVMTVPMASCIALSVVLLLCIWEWRAGNAFFKPLIFTAAITSAGYLLALLIFPGFPRTRDGSRSSSPREDICFISASPIPPAPLRPSPAIPAAKGATATA